MSIPETQDLLRPLNTKKGKLGILRDICIVMGVQMRCKDYNLENKDTNFIPPSQKNATPVYSMLPFAHEDISDLLSVIKHLDITNNDVRTYTANAKSAFKENYLEQAFEYYNQCMNIHLQISGPLNKDVATCISKLANIHFKFGDYYQAIQLQMKSVIVHERMFGLDHPQTAYNYSNLALFNHYCGKFSKAFECMYRSLSILNVVVGDQHPDISSLYVNLGLMYQDVDNHQAAIDCFFEALYRNIHLFGDKHMNVASCYQAIALAHNNIGDYRKALEYQEKAHKILVQIYPENDPYIKQSLSTIDQFTRLSVQKEKANINEKQQSKSLSLNFRPKTIRHQPSSDRQTIEKDALAQ